MRAFTDQRVVLLDGDMRETASYIFGDGQLERYCVAPDGRLVLVMGNYEKDKRLSIVTLDRDLTQINRFETDINVWDILCGQQLSLSDGARPSACSGI